MGQSEGWIECNRRIEQLNCFFYITRSRAFGPEVSSPQVKTIGFGIFSRPMRYAARHPSALLGSQAIRKANAIVDGSSENSLDEWLIAGSPGRRKPSFVLMSFSSHQHMVASGLHTSNRHCLCTPSSRPASCGSRALNR